MGPTLRSVMVSAGLIVVFPSIAHPGTVPCGGTPELVNTIQTDHLPVGVTWHAGELWTVDAQGTVREVDPITEVTGSTIGTGLATHNGLASDGSTLFMSYDPGGNTRFKAVLPDGADLLTPTSGARDMTSDGSGMLWYADFDEGKIVKMSTAGELLRLFPAPGGFGAQGIEWDGEHLLFNRHDDSVLYLIDPDDGSFDPACSIDFSSYGNLGNTAWDGELLYSVRGNADIQVFRIVPEPTSLLMLLGGAGLGLGVRRSGMWGRHYRRSQGSSARITNQSRW